MRLSRFLAVAGFAAMALAHPIPAGSTAVHSAVVVHGGQASLQTAPQRLYILFRA